MGRLLAGFGGLFALVLVPLALAPNVIWMVIPGHLIFSIIVTLGALQQGFDGRRRGAQAWGGLYLVTSLAIAWAMDSGAYSRNSGYWMVPWALLLTWGWIPAVAISVGVSVGPARRRRLNAKVVQRRKKRSRETKRSGPPLGADGEE
jgi:hypothetical protein